MKSIQTITIEAALKPATISAIEAVNLRIEAHAAAIAAHVAEIEGIKSASLGEIDGSKLFNPKATAARQAAQFDLLAEELAIRNELVPIYEARQADRQAHADKLEAAIEPAREAIVGKLQRIGFVGDGLSYESQTPGSIFPAMVLGHQSVKAARDAAVNARAVLNATGDIQANERRIVELENELRGALAAAA